MDGAPSETISLLPVEEIRAECNDRRAFDPSSLADLAASILAHGLAQPITVRPSADGPGYLIVAGERRYRAHLLAGLPTIPTIIRTLSDRAASAVMLAENLSRSDLDPMEEARAYQSRIERFGMIPEEVAAMAGVKVTRVRWRLDLLRLDATLAHFVSRGTFAVGFAWELRDLDVNRQHLAFRALDENPDLGLAAFKALCSRLLLEQSQEAMFQHADFFQMAEYVSSARDAADARRPGRKALATMLARMADELAHHDPANQMVALARQVAAAGLAA